MLSKIKCGVFASFAMIAMASQGNAATVNFADVDTQTVSSFSQDGVTITSSGMLQFTKFNGLGVAGGATSTNPDSEIGVFETVQFDFGDTVHNLTYTLGGISIYDPSAIPGRRKITAFKEGTIVGSVFDSDHSLNDSISDMFAGLAFDAVSIRGYAGSSFKLYSISFDQISAVPLPAAVPLFAAGMGILGLMGWRRKRAA